MLVVGRRAVRQSGRSSLVLEMMAGHRRHQNGPFPVASINRRELVTISTGNEERLRWWPDERHTDRNVCGQGRRRQCRDDHRVAGVARHDYDERCIEAMRQGNEVSQNVGWKGRELRGPKNFSGR